MLNKEDFDNWNNLKKDINFGKIKKNFPKEGEVWNIYNGINIGFESIGKGEYFERPFLIIKKLGNMFLCLSMTTKGKDNHKFYYKLNNNYFNKKSYLTLSQGKCIDNKRFIKKMGEITRKDLFEIKKELKTLWL